MSSSSSNERRTIHSVAGPYTLSLCSTALDAAQLMLVVAKRSSGGISAWKFRHDLTCRGFEITFPILMLGRRAATYYAQISRLEVNSKNLWLSVFGVENQSIRQYSHIIPGRMATFRHEFGTPYQYDSFPRNSLMCGLGSEIYFFSYFDHAIRHFTLPALDSKISSKIQPIRLEFADICCITDYIIDMAVFSRRLLYIYNGAITSFDLDQQTAVSRGLAVNQHYKLHGFEATLFLLSETLNSVWIVDPVDLSLSLAAYMTEMPLFAFYANKSVQILTPTALIACNPDAPQFPRITALPARVSALSADLEGETLVIATKQRYIVRFNFLSGRQVGSLQNAMKYQPTHIAVQNERIIVLSQANECLVHASSRKSNRFSGIRADGAWEGFYLAGNTFVGLTARGIYLVSDVWELADEENSDSS